MKILKKKKYKISLKLIKLSNITKSYVKWMNDYEVVKYTEQKFKKHTTADIKKFVKEKINSSTDLKKLIAGCYNVNKGSIGV